MSTLVYKYYAEPSTPEDEALIREQIVLAAKYRRVLADLENNLRTAERACEDECPIVRSRRRRVACWYEIESSTSGRKREIATAALKKYKDALYVALKTRWGLPSYQTAVGALRATRSVAVRLARSNCNLAWGTYQHVEEAHATACRTSRRLDTLKVRAPFDEGSIAIHIQNRVLRTETLIGGTDTFIRLGGTLVPRRQGKPARFRELKIRVGSEGRDPVWATFRVLLHRDLVPGDLKWVRVHRERTGLRYRYSVQFVIACDPLPVSAPTAEIVGVDLGWRRVENGYRVAYANGSDGTGHELVIPSTVTDRKGKTEDLRSIRSQTTDGIRTLLVNYRATLTPDHWFTDATTHLHMWRRIGRFVHLFREWTKSRIAGDGPVYDAIEAWLKQDRHLLAWESHNDRRMRNQIRARVEQWAAMLTTRYGTIAVEKLKASDLRDGDSQVAKLTRERGAFLAPFTIIARLKVAAGKRGRAVTEVKAAYTSMICAGCSSMLPKSPDLTLDCSTCGPVDRDSNAAINIRMRAVQCKGPGAWALDPTTTATSTPRKIRARSTRKRKPSPLEIVVLSDRVSEVSRL